MSGGSYDYAYAKFTEMADQLRIPSEGEEYGDSAPAEVRAAFRELLRRVSDAAHAIEWNDSGDGDGDEVGLILACLPVDLLPNPQSAAVAARAAEDRCRDAYEQAKKRRIATDQALEPAP